MNRIYITFLLCLNLLASAAYAQEFSTKIVNDSSYKITINELAILAKQGVNHKELWIDVKPKLSVLEPGKHTVAVTNIDNASTSKTFIDYVSITVHGHKYEIKKVVNFLKQINKVGFTPRQYYSEKQDNIGKRMMDIFGNNPELRASKYFLFNSWIPNSTAPFYLSDHDSVMPVNGKAILQITITGEKELNFSKSKITI